MDIKNIVTLFIGTYAIQVGLLWGVMEGYSYFGDDRLKKLLGPYWILLYIVPAIISVCIVAVRGFRQSKSSEDLQSSYLFSEDQDQVATDVTITTQRTEYTNFMAFNPKGTPLPTTIPPHSFINSVRGIVSRPISPKQLGLSEKDYPKGCLPHVPEGEMVIDFTISSRRGTAVVSAITLEIVDVYDKPKKTQSSGYMPVLEPIEESATIRRGTSTYRLFPHKTFSYKNGEVDLFRLNVLIADSEKPCVFNFRLKVEYTINSDRAVSYSEDYYLAKARRGETPRILYAKHPLHHQRLEEQPQTIEKEEDLKGHGDFYTDGRFFERFFSGRDCKSIDSSECTNYIKQNLTTAIMPSPKRTAVEKNGFGPVEDLTPFGLREVNGPSKDDAPIVVTSGEWAIAVPPGDRGYRSTIYTSSKLEVYGGRYTEEYNRLCLSCKCISELGTEHQRAEVVALFSEIYGKEQWDTGIKKWDIASLYDLLPLLSLFRVKTCYDIITMMLYFNNPVIVDRAASILASVRYRQSSGPLLYVLREKAQRTFTSATVLSAVAMNCDTSHVAELVDIFEHGVFVIEELLCLADALVKIAASATVIELASKYSTERSPSKQRLSYLILKAMKSVDG